LYFTRSKTYNDRMSLGFIMSAFQYSELGCTHNKVTYLVYTLVHSENTK